MTRHSQRAACCLSIAVGAVLLAGFPSPARNYRARDYFADAKVAELAEAARGGEIERVDELVSQGVNVNARGKEGWTPLMYSMTGTGSKGLKRLLERGANPNLQTERGDSAVSFAARRKEPRRVGNAQWH